MNADRVIVAHATEAALLGRISVLWQRRAVDRRVYGASWPQARWDRHVELRALLAVRRSGRQLARRTTEQADPVTAAKRYADWTELELREVFA